MPRKINDDVFGFYCDKNAVHHDGIFLKANTFENAQIKALYFREILLAVKAKLMNNRFCEVSPSTTLTSTSFI